MQYPLPLCLPPVFAEDNFFVSPCNREAYRWVAAWPDWPGHALLLYGAAGCGKSHLGHVWMARAAAGMVEAADMPGMPPEALRGNMLIENIERLGDARALLHAFNYARENGSQLLLTSGVPPHSLPFTLPDLMSRLLALPAAHIDQPDDDLLAAAMRKQFADRQMKVDEEVVAYVLPRIERSLGEVARVVKWLDGCALAEHKDITVRFVRRMLSIPSPLES